MLERIKKLKDLRRKVRKEKPNCPMCQVQMKRKGKKGKNVFYKCPKCKGKLQAGTFVSPPNPETLDIRCHELKEMRKEQALRKLVRKLKKEKYLGYQTFQWEGRIINLDDYDKDGISLEEKKKMEEEKKKMEEAKKKQVEKKEELIKEVETKCV